MALIQNYIKVSLRDLKRNKTFTIINLTGLVAGMTVSLLMLQYVLFETSFDKFHDDYDRIYRVVNDRYQNGELVQHGTITYPTIGPTMAADFPEVEAYTRMLPGSRNYIEYENELFLSTSLLIADEHFPTLFSFDMLHGRKEDCLDAAFKVVLTKFFAEKLIGANQNISSLVGQSIILWAEPLKITGIVENPPENSHLKFDLLVSYKTYITLAGQEVDDSWEWSDFYHYVKLKEGVDVTSLEGKLADFGVRYFKKGEVSGGEEQFFLQPLAKAHLDNSMEYEIGDVTNGRIVWLMLVVAVFIVILAWINYINLNTGRALQRAKEVGIRKSVGAQKNQIIRQFFVETILLNILALVSSIGLVILLQPFFNELTGLQLSLLQLWNASIIGIPFSLFLIITLFLSLILVALYPALLITRFSTQDILKGSFRLKGEIVWLRKGMVIFQFMIAVVLITSAIAINRQVEFMINKDLGIDIENTMVIYGPNLTDWDSTFLLKVDRLKNEMVSLSGVEKVTTSSRVLGSRMGRIFQVKSTADPEAKNLTTNFINTDHNFSELFGIKVLAGRDFDFQDHHFDGKKVKNILINEAALSLLKYPTAESSIGRTVKFWNKNWTIIGVVNDFHQLSMHEQIEPIFLIPYYDPHHSISAKLSGKPTEALISSIEDKFNTQFPGNYFDYYFLEDQFRQLYRDDIRVGKISNGFTLLSILIAVLGLYGLVMMTIVRKTKEIGMRKVLGANLGQLLILLSKEFMILVVIAVLLGGPLSFFSLMEWKAGFAYSADIGVELILVSSLLLILISVLTIAFQTKKISRNNPVESLRCE